jgi:3-polyprenyl-4-hydroxybenzoate decarboxylase
MCFRSDPEKDIDIIRRTWSTPLDPIIRKPTKAHYASRAIIDACRPFEWKEDFPAVIKLDQETVAGIRRKWPETEFADSE